tara:strand:- start:111277 stop:112437 length:1161 start_codon:yes stop_codon:yes gene_type:complete
VQLSTRKNIRKPLLRGQPWIYRDTLAGIDRNAKTAQWARLSDHKGEFLAWGMYDPHGHIAFRVVSLQDTKPKAAHLDEKLQNAFLLRESLFNSDTNGFRCINGEGDWLPGLVADRYGEVIVLQTDGLGPYEFWNLDHIAHWFLKKESVTTVYFKPRSNSPLDPQTWGKNIDLKCVSIQESGRRYLVNILDGQKTGFFYDQRENRDFIQSIAGGAHTLNLFSYTGGFSVAAGQGGAPSVTSVDLSSDAIDLCQQSWEQNDLLPDAHKGHAKDVFQYLNQENQKYDLVICDPPSMAKSEKAKPAAIKKYVESFSAALRSVKPNGYAALSSCSSQISFQDFSDIVDQALTQSKRRAQSLRVSGQGPDHPFPQACPQLRYLKFYALKLSK